jgi:transposase
MRKCNACGSNNISSVSSPYEGNYEECRDCGKRTSIPSYEELVRQVAELETENKALHLIANSHSMSELRRMKIMTNYDPAPKEVKE